MNVTSIVTRFFFSVTPFMHKTRRLCLQAAVESALGGAAISVTGLGRFVRNNALEKHRIKRMDRLLSNAHLQGEVRSIYKQLTRKLVGKTRHPIIHIDWSDMDERSEHFLLRACVVAEGRSLTLYEELHPLKAKDKPKTHRTFLLRLKGLLPESAVPILVTDAGFRIPWFRLVRSLGWDYVGRVRNRTQCLPQYLHCEQGEKDHWHPIKNLYDQATHRAQELGSYWLGASIGFPTRLVIWRRRLKGRHHKTADGKRTRHSKRSRGHAKREREPWLLATSLDEETYCARQVTKIYATRMQIEEGFRDLKSGLGMAACRSRDRTRLSVLLLIATLAHTLLYWIGLAVKQAGAHWSYQSTSVKTRAILSNITIGLCAYRDRRLKLKRKHWNDARRKLTQQTANICTVQ